MSAPSFHTMIGAISAFTIGGKGFEVGGDLLIAFDLTDLTSNGARVTERVR